MTPKVSVIVPNYNHSRFLRQRLESIYNQTYRDFELIILDDKSTDDSVNVIKTIIEENKDSGIPTRFLANEENSGSTFKQWKKGLYAAKGEYVWIAESDDWADEKLIESLMKNIQSNCLDMCFCQSMNVDEDGNFLCEHMVYGVDFYSENQIFTLSMIQKYITKFNLIPNASAVIFNKNISLYIIDEILGFKFCGDWLFWNLFMVKGEKFGYNSDSLNYYRRHKKSVTSTKKINPNLYEAEQFRIIKIMADLGIECDIHYWMKHWLSINNYRIKSIFSSDSLWFFKFFYQYDKISPIKIMIYILNYRYNNLKIKIRNRTTRKD